MAADKKSSITVDGLRYIYTIRERRNGIKVIIYSPNEKNPYFTVRFSYLESWGFNVYRPKTIEIFIKFYNKNRNNLSKNEFYIMEQPLLFKTLFECYFTDSNKMEQDKFLECCMGQEYFRAMIETRQLDIQTIYPFDY